MHYTGSHSNNFGYSAIAAPLPSKDIFPKDETYTVGKNYQNAVLKNLKDIFEDLDSATGNSKGVSLSGK